ncbi:MAG: TetR/AcrR family transcriptional regulator [Thermodesulfobacteriota bacterium]
MSDNGIQARTTFSNLPLEKQKKIIEVAVREFARQGYRKASMNTVVREAGIAKGSLYQYFSSKEALFLFLFDRFTDLVKKTVKEAGGVTSRGDFFSRVSEVLLAGLLFIDRYPDYFQIYLQVLFEHDVPERQRLLSQVRLFSFEYFGPLCEEARRQGELRRDIPLAVLVFILDAALDRFLQSYARSYLDCGLHLAGQDGDGLARQIDQVLTVLREGMAAGRFEI